MLGAWLKRYLEWRRAQAFAVGLGIVLSLPSLRLGLALDDFWQRGKLLGARWPVGPAGTFHLFDFADGSPAEHASFIQRGFVPWWATPGLRISFFRPLSCLTHALDYALWPTSPTLMHAQSILWYGALLVLVALAFRRFLPLASANVATLFYAIDPTHSLPVGWLANRNALVAATFAIGALLLYDQRRHLLAAGALALALLSGESATAVLGFFVAHWVFLERRKPTAFLPLALVVAGWAIHYKLAGHGVAGSGIYVDPTRRPLDYLVAVAGHVPVLLGDELNAPPPDMFPFLDTAAKAGLIVIATAFIAWTAWVAPRADKTTRFLALGSLLGVLPGAAAFPSGRLLLVAGFGLVGIVAQILTAPRTTKPAKLFGWLSWVSHFGFAIPMFVFGLGGMQLVDHTIRVLGDGVPINGSAAAKRLVLVNAPDTSFSYYFIVHPLEAGLAPPEKMLIAASNARDVTLTRTGPSTIRMQEEGGFYRDGSELLYRDPSVRTAAGERFDQGDVTITVRHVGADGIPDETEIVFQRPLDEGYVFRAWRGNALVPFELPPIGEHVTFPGRRPMFL